MPSPTEGPGSPGIGPADPGGSVPADPTSRSSSTAAGDSFRLARPGRPSAEAFAVALLLSAALQIMENLLPRLPVFPWLKLGLSHIVLLPFLLRFGPGPAAALLLGRNLLTLLFAAGSLSTFLIGTVSGLASLLVGGFAVRLLLRHRLLGLAGAGMTMAALMNLSQLAVVEGLIIRSTAFYFQLAPMFLWSAISGAAVAWLALRSRAVLDSVFDLEGDASPDPSLLDAAALRQSRLPFLLALAALVGLFLLPNPASQGAALFALLLFSRLRGVLRAGLLNLARAWPWFLYLAWLHLLLGEGAYLPGGFITREGLHDFLWFGARLAGLILLGPHLAAAFPKRWLAGSASPYARGTLAVLPLLPGLHGAAIGAGRAFFAAFKARGKGGIRGEGAEGEAGVLRALADGFRRPWRTAGRPPPRRLSS
jgi:uncharacterized membrane protein